MSVLAGEGAENSHVVFASDRRTTYNAVVATDEATTNAVSHGSNLSPEMEFVVGRAEHKDCLVILVRDFGGKRFDPEYFEAISQKKTWGIEGGRGILLISRAMDEVMFLSHPGRSTTVCMLTYLGSE